ncbi:restriction endonuclease [Deinococcus reticulitermitis]|nr:restriction endonuclease [Deinococcus reticulitermitis]
MARASRTLNPLHFEDLEPHRFEDLVRQLAYDYRVWSSIEATGRGGADDGIDIRAFESSVVPEVLDEEEDEAPPGLPTPGRLWILQCKREKRITPKQVERYVQESITGEQVPYGFILAAACDFSKKSYDAFRAALIGTGVQEFHLWGKAELEDMLFQPKNDPLLFAYFGISLQTRKRSRQSELRAVLAWRKRVGRILGNPTDILQKEILFRDATDEAYPLTEEVADFEQNPRWAIYRVRYFNARNALILEIRSHLAFHDTETGEWDMLPDPVPSDLDNQLWGKESEYSDLHWRRQHAWQRTVPEKHRAELVVLNRISLERVLAVDEVGDLAHPLPIFYVEPLPSGRLLDAEDEFHYLTSANYGLHKPEYDADPEKRIPYFKEFKLEAGDEQHT